MRVAIIFADPGYFNGLVFSKWLEGESDDKLLLLPDQTPNGTVPSLLSEMAVATQVTFRLHKSADPKVKTSQRNSILAVWKDALELDGFSHHEPISMKISALMDVQNDTECKSRVSEVVKGASNQSILKQLDNLAASKQLLKLAGRARPPNVTRDFQDCQDKLERTLPEKISFLKSDPTAEKLASFASDFID